MLDMTDLRGIAAIAPLGSYVHLIDGYGSAISFSE